MNEPHCHQLALSYLGREVDVAAEQLGPRRYRLTFEENSLEVSGTLSGEELSADVDGFRQRLSIAEHDGLYSVYGPAGAFSFAERAADLGGDEIAGPGGNPRAPMNGTVVQLLAEAGQKVEADAPLLVMEAMKMEHTIRAPAAGVVTEFYVAAGELVDGDAELLNFEAETEA